MGNKRKLLERLASAFVDRFKGFNVYVSNPNGFMGFGREETLTPISEERYQRILRELVNGVLFDCLHVTRHNDSYRGFTLAHREGEIELMCSFRSLKHPEKMEGFREAMKRLGYVQAEEHPWNVGLGEDMENTSLTYRCAVEFQPVLELSNNALDLLDGESRDFFVHLWRSQDGPNEKGIRIVRPKDILKEIP